jgi:hypothetical protein
VTKEQGQALATQWGCPFFEASAKTRANHEECFFEVPFSLQILLYLEGCSPNSKIARQSCQSRKEERGGMLYHPLMP